MIGLHGYLQTMSHRSREENRKLKRKGNLSYFEERKAMTYFSFPFLRENVYSGNLLLKLL